VGLIRFLLAMPKFRYTDLEDMLDLSRGEVRNVVFSLLDSGVILKSESTPGWFVVSSVVQSVLCGISEISEAMSVSEAMSSLS